MNRLMGRAGLTRDGQLQPEEKQALLQKKGFQVRHSKTPVEARMAMVRVPAAEDATDGSTADEEGVDLQFEREDTMRAFFGDKASARSPMAKRRSPSKA